METLKLLRKWLAPPVFPEDEEKTRIAGLLNTITYIILALALLFSIPALIITPSLERILAELILIALGVGMIYLLRRGYVRLSGYLLSFALWLVITVVTYQYSGGFSGSTMSSYFGIVIIAALLLGGWAGAIFGVLSIAATGWMLYAELQGFAPPVPPQANTYTLWMDFSVTMVGVVGLLALTVSNLNQALRRARQDEKELAQKMVEIQTLAAEAAEASDFKSRLIARVSHELRTPLGAILGMTEMLHYETYGPLSQTQKDATQRIIDNSKYLEIVFGELLEQSQIESRRLGMKEVEFKPRAVVERVHANYLQAANRQGLQLTSEVDPNLPELLFSDPTRIEQILSNLVSNAIKFTPAGSIFIHAYRVDETRWAIQVRDSGIGIPIEARQFIFEPFRQVDESIARQHGGIGLGLSIVKQLVELLQGQIELESQVGQGSTFTVLLPLKFCTESTTEFQEAQV